MKKLHLFMFLLLAMPMSMLAAGTTWQEATQLPLGQEQQGSLASGRDYEWWKFTVTVDGSATFTIAPGSGLRISDLRLYYYNSNQTNYWERTANNYYTNPGWYQGGFTTPDLTAGTYLLRVQRGEGSGSYTISVNFTPQPFTNDPEPDGAFPSDAAKPGLLPLNVATQGHLGYGYASGSEDNTDWWNFTVAADGETNIHIDHDSSLRIQDVRLYYYNATQSNYWERTDNNYYVTPGWYSADLSIPNLAPGTYLLRILHGEGQGGYELTYTHKANEYANNTEADGQFPDSDAKPGVLPLNTGKQGHLGYGYGSGNDDTSDWWAFDVTQDGAATISITHDGSLNIGDVRLYYYNSDKTNYWERTSNTYYMTPSWYRGEMRVPDLAPGKYLILVQRGEGQGGYELKCDFETQAYKNDTEPNNTWNEGRDNNYLPRGQERQAHLGYGYSSANDDNYDWWTISVPRDGKVRLTYTPTSDNSQLRASDLRLYYFNSDKTNCWERTSNNYYVNPSWYLATLEVPDMAPGDYLVRVERGEGYGAYSLKYEFEQNDLPNDDEPDAWNTPTKLPQGQTLSGHLGYGYVSGSEDNYDWYEVTMTAKGTLTVNVHPGNNLKISDMRLYYYNANKTNYWERTQGNYYVTPGWYSASLSATDVEPGDYLVRLSRGEGYGNYRIAFNAEIADVTPLTPLPDESLPDDQKPDDPTPGTSGNHTLVVWLQDSSKHIYKLSEKPKVTLSGDTFTLTTTATTATYKATDVWKFTLGDKDGNSVGISDATTQAATEAQAVRHADSVEFSGCRPGAIISIYTTSGRLVSTQRAGADGSATVSTASLAAGTYILKADSVTLKIAKR